ncbi:MAG TPA: DUF3037 domain-containing protein [Ktedonobacterales bacterium]|jgi:Protein of unknown function (DUF3037)|nr:DUF3037 domain-containing protein [Ktedonobacterales bacterium]
MPARKASYDYALIRVTPLVERGECMNVGVILFCRTRAYLGARINLDEARLLAFFPFAVIDDIRAQLHAIAKIAEGEKEAGPIAALSQAERFHWLVSPRSTIVQPSPVHSGLCDDPTAALEHLFQTMVLLPPTAEDTA